MKLLLLLGCTGLCWLGGGAIAARAENPAHVRQLLQTNACENCDLSGANLGSLNLTEANLGGANLQGANLSRTLLLRTNLAGTNLREATLAGSSLQGANLQRADLSGATLGNLCGPAELALEPAVCQIVNLIQRLGPELCEADYGLSASLASSILGDEYCQGASATDNVASLTFGWSVGFGLFMHGMNLMGADLRGANLSGLDLQGADLRYAQLADTDLTNTNLAYALLLNAEVSGARNGDFEQAFLQPTDLGRLLSPLLEAYAQYDAYSRGWTYVGSMNRAQQAYQVEYGRFTTELEDLGLGIEPEDEFYRFAIAATTEDYTVQVAIARQPEMTSYLGLVYLVSTQEGPITVAVVCETINPWTQLPEIGPSPATLEEEPTCPEGFEVLSSSIE
ncbi:pentapeptide repeat-containing protein [Pseudanabaena sp. FACHB-2040]|uniref:pentapeptide repeat-containing protein n=1 Tax=Pseudanabaena sp. FACHB-2040 TaxID=2692859 RepID=UPI001688355C|nr:pentapeptide repeat-containing protein [Pseudanabaena sp. FACHB-2040]MBD2259569.1 pentapeptide repeat-containing protein [Pseudanabaena sp. FACHB-2040]